LHTAAVHEARLAERGEDGLLELNAADDTRHGRYFDGSTIGMIDAARRHRIKRFVLVMTRSLDSSANLPPRHADDAVNQLLTSVIWHRAYSIHLI
jgi:hypothetical protein